MEQKDKKPGVSNTHMVYSMIGIFGFSVLLMLILILTSLSDGDKDTEAGRAAHPRSGNRKHGPDGPKTVPAEEKEEQLQKEFEHLCSRVLQHIESGEFAAAESLLSTAKQVFPDRERVSELKARIAEGKKKGEADIKFRIFTESAERAALNEQWSLAVANYENALAVRDSAEIRKKLAQATFNTHVKKADEYISAGDIPKAVSEYKKARLLAENPGLKQKADELFKKISASEQVQVQNRKYESCRDRAEILFEKGEYHKARSLFTVAADYTTSATQDEYLRSRLQACGIKIAEEKKLIAYGRLVEEAQQAEKTGDYRKAVALYKKALDMKPGNSRLTDKIRELSLLLLPSTITDTTGITMALIPGGTFVRGSTLSSSKDCKPERSIYVSPFYMDITEITNLQYEQFDPLHTRPPQSKEDHMPVTGISWNDVVRFCAWRSAKNNAHYRLPTEAEWEKAARGGDGRPFSWGYSFSKDKGWVERNPGTAAAVTSFGPNPFGLYNMSGNVWEWCMDRYSPDYYTISGLKNPDGPSRGTYRVVRGGSFRFGATSCRTYERNAEKPGKRMFDIGFRTVRTVVKEERKEQNEVEPGVILK